MDIAYLRAHPAQLPVLLTHQRIRETPVSGGDICDTVRLTLDGGESVFAKSWPAGAGTAPDGFFAAEAHGLRWLRDAAAVPVPEVLVELPGMLVLEWVEPGDPSPAAAERLGRDLAALHRTRAAAFGADWPGFVGRLPLDNTPTATSWPEWFASRRLEPYLRMSQDRGALSAADVAVVGRVLSRIDGYGGAEPPSRIHGDLWPGNLLWGDRGRVWLVDPAAHGGHRETDLALLELFGGAPHSDRIRAAYHEEWPLGDGWRQRVPLHQLYLLLVHTALFGSSYRDPVLSAARRL